jgi:hypothetical protein
MRYQGKAGGILTLGSQQGKKESIEGGNATPGAPEHKNSRR